MLDKPLVLKHLMLVLLPVIVVFSSANSSYGFTITTKLYTESPKSFKWIFTWDGNTAKTETPVYTPPPESNNECPGIACWNNSLVGLDENNFVTTLSFLGQHSSREHPGDFAFGEGIMELVDLAGLIPSTGKQLFEVPVGHKHDPLPNHSDIYKASYTRQQANGPVTFTFQGIHTVPEPSATIGFIALGILSTISTLKRQQN